MEYTVLTSRKNPAVVNAAALSADKKSRDASGLFAAEGVKLLGEVLSAGLSVESVFFTGRALDTLGAKLDIAGADRYLVTDEVFAKLTTESAPQGVYACVRKPENGVLSDEILAEGGFVMLDEVQNPANIGAILRSAFALGFERILLTKTSADIYSPKCVRAAMGSLFRIKPFFTDDLPKDIERAGRSGARVFCTLLSEHSARLGSVRFAASDSFVVGNEGHGVSAAVADACSHSLTIPMNPGAESLNAAAAAGIVMWEMKKDHLLAHF